MIGAVTFVEARHGANRIDAVEGSRGRCWTPATGRWSWAGAWRLVPVAADEAGRDIGVVTGVDGGAIEEYWLSTVAGRALSAR